MGKKDEEMLYIKIKNPIKEMEKKAENHVTANEIKTKQFDESSRRERLTPDLSHHRTYGSVYGGSIKIIDARIYNALEDF